MCSAAQVLRQAESLKASLVETGKLTLTADGGKGTLEGGKGTPEAGKGVSDHWVTRQKLEDVYKRLLLIDLEYALDKKVEQDLWNHAFKNQITALQTQAKDKHNPKKAEVQANLNLFLETASGFYLQFLQLICSTFKVDLPFRRKSSAFGVMKEKTQLRAKITPPKRSSCYYICQYCLVHLGDIARYRQQVEQAQTYYRHAVNLSPQNGQPYNQLAILEVNRNNKLSSVFYYVRSLAVRHPFPVAATNLEKFYTKLIKDRSEFKGKMAQNEFVNAFLQFQALLHLTADLNRASYLCGRILACLPAHLAAQTFSASVLVHCVAITVFTLNHVRHVPSGGPPPLSTLGSPKGEGAGGGEEVVRGVGGGEKVETEEFLSGDEQKCLDIVLAFTASVLELLVLHTPLGPAKARDSPTLPAIQVLLDWLRHSPDIITLPPFASSNIWGHLAKMLNVVQQYEEGKPCPDLTKYDEVPLPEDTELRCFQPIEMAHSKYSFTRIPVDGFPRGVEEQVRCARLVNQGKTIAEEFQELKMTATQQKDPPRINFAGPLIMKSTETVPSPRELRAKQNVAMQAIMKQGQGGQPDATRGGSATTEQTSPKYLLGTVTSEPQFMKHGGGGGGSTGRLQTSPQLSPGFQRRGQSPLAGGTSPMPAGFAASPRVASPRPGNARVASPLPPSQRKETQGQPGQGVATAASQQQHKEASSHSLSTTAAPPSGQTGNVRLQPSPSPSSPPDRSQAALSSQQQYLTSAPYQGPAQGHDQGHLPQGQGGHLPQGHGQLHLSQGHSFQGQGPQGHGQSQGAGYPGYPVSYSAVGGERFQAPQPPPPPPRMGAGLGPQAQMEAPRMQQGFQPASPEATTTTLTSAASTAAGPRHPLNPEMLSALRLASQISHHQQQQQQQQGGEAGLHLSPASQQDAPPPPQPQPLPPTHAMFRPSLQRPVSAAARPRGGVTGVSPSATMTLTPGGSYAGMPRPFLHPGMGLPPQHPHPHPHPHQHPHPSGDVPLHAFSSPSPSSVRPHPHPQPHPRMHGGGTPRGPEMGRGQGQGQGQVGKPRLQAPPIPMPGHSAASGYPAMMTGLYPEEGGGSGGGGGRGERGRGGYQALSPLTIQPPKSSPPDTRISTSFQGHAEGTPKPDKQGFMAPEKREMEPVVHRVVMPVGQPGGEYSLFASSSPWSMPLNAGNDSKSMASSPLSSHESSMRNSPVVGFEPQGPGPYDNSGRRKGSQGEGWMQGQGYEEQKGRGQGHGHGQQPGGMPPMWMEGAAMTPLERLLEQQRLQRQIDPH